MIIKSTLAALALAVGLALCSSDQAVGSSCGRAEVQAVTWGGVYHLRPGQVRRANRRAARLHRRDARLAARHGCAAPRGCGVAVIVPQVRVEVGSACSGR